MNRSIVNPTEADIDKYSIIDKLLANTISLHELKSLRKIINSEDLSYIIQHIYDLNESYIFKLSTVEGMLKKMNATKNKKRNARFTSIVKNNFRSKDQSSHKIILAEGDSWFNYPVILTDIIDRISMEKDLAVYSIASGGDWLLNMLSGREYIEELSVIHPDWFLISGGGNDLLGSRRLATIVQPGADSGEYKKNEWTNYLMEEIADKKFILLDEEKFNAGLKYLSKDFFALLMFFHLQYYFMINGIICGGKEGKPPKFPGMKIITQGYDFAVPSHDKNFGFNPLLWYVPFIRTFLGHGRWMKTPFQIRGITGQEVQENVMYAMIYLFNEMMIEMGSLFNTDKEQKIFHIDSRNSVGAGGWTDELHPRPNHFMNTGDVFVRCIKETSKPNYKHVYVVNTIHHG